MELEHANLEAILDELAKRYTAVLISYVKDAKNAPEKEQYNCVYKGGWIQACGLAAVTVEELKNPKIIVLKGEEDES